MNAATVCQDENFPASMGNDHNTAALQCKLLLVDLLRDVRAYLLAHSPYESLAEQVCIQHTSACHAQHQQDGAKAAAGAAHGGC
jgi:hypothetical protein